MGNKCTPMGKKKDEINFLNVLNFMKKILKLLRREHKRPKDTLCSSIKQFNPVKILGSRPHENINDVFARNLTRWCWAEKRTKEDAAGQMKRMSCTGSPRTVRAQTRRKAGNSEDRPQHTEGVCDKEDSLNYWTEGGLLRKRGEKAGKPLERSGESKTLTSFLMQL